MKFVTLILGLAAFLVVLLPALQAGRPFDLALRDSALAAVLGAICGRWLWRRFESEFADLLAQRRAVAAAELKDSASAPNRAEPRNPPSSLK
jgi:hypothetical protein